MNKNTNSIPVALQDLLVKLRVLSMIGAGNKLNISNLSIIEKDSWTGAFYRALTGENRKNTINYVNQIIDDSIKALGEYSDTEFCALIVNALANAKMGIINLGTTYQNDLNFSAHIKVLTDNIDLQLDKNKNLLNGHVK